MTQDEAKKESKWPAARHGGYTPSKQPPVPVRGDWSGPRSGLGRFVEDNLKPKPVSP